MKKLELISLSARFNGLQSTLWATFTSISPRIREAKARSFSDAEAGEDGVEEGISGYGACNGTQMMQGFSDIMDDQLWT